MIKGDGYISRQIMYVDSMVTKDQSVLLDGDAFRTVNLNQVA